MTQQYSDAWRNLIRTGRSWVLFKHGTVVVFTDSLPGVRHSAIAVLRRSGPVGPGSPSGDFAVSTSPKHAGWIVSYDHPDIMTYVGPDEVSRDPSGRPPDDVTIGLFGRDKRGRDAAELEVIHVSERKGESDRPLPQNSVPPMSRLSRSMW